MKMTEKKTYWVATMNSEHFEWVALGETKEQAGKALLRRWNKHKIAMAKYGREVESFRTWSELNEYYGIRFWELEPNRADMI
jgi:hypothetical protein